MTTCRSIAIRTAIISLLAFSVEGVSSSSTPPRQQLYVRRKAVSSRQRNDTVIAFQQYDCSHGSIFASPAPLSASSRAKQRCDNIITNTICNNNNNINNNLRNRHHHRHKNSMILLNKMIKNNDDEGASTSSASFLSTDKAKVTFQNRNTMSNSNNSRLLSNTLSPMDQFLLTLTSDRTSLLLGSIGIILLLLNRLLTFPDGNVLYEASRSRMDLLGVFAAGSVLLNGITKLDVESVRAEKVVLEGRIVEEVMWDVGTLLGEEDTFRSIVEWALLSYLKCTPAKTAILLTKRVSPQQEGSNSAQWLALARVGVVPFKSKIPNKTPILDRMFSGDSSIKGGTVGGADVAVGTAAGNRKGGPKESYLPTLQALPGKVEFTYLPSNAQEALILSVSSPSTSGAATAERWNYAVVLGGDVAKSFAPRDVAWCKEIASWIGDLV